MSDQIIGLHHWFDSPPGRYLLAWEQARFDEAVANIFGYHSLQLGMPLLDGLRANRMPHQWLAMGQEAVQGSIAFVETGGVDGPLQRRAVDLLTEPVALPFPAASLDRICVPAIRAIPSTFCRRPRSETAPHPRRRQKPCRRPSGTAQCARRV